MANSLSIPPIPNEVISQLSQKNLEIPDWSLLIKDYEPTLHRINKDQNGREDKIRSGGKIDKASRIHIGLEKLLTARTNEFMFSIPVKRIYHNIEGNETRRMIARAMESIYKYARIDTENKKRGLAYFASCEILTIWYAIRQPNAKYGFPSEYKLKCRTFSPMDNVSLYPQFDDYGDMTAMSLQYSVKDGVNETSFFESYTADSHRKWRYRNGTWEEILTEDITIIGKIPAIYLWRQYPIYHGLSHIREEIEYTLSRNSDVVAYNSAPILKIVGKINGAERKGETQRVYRMENGGDIDYVTWGQAIEALRYHIATLLNLFWTQGQMPDISFDNMKSLGNIGYDARQTLLTDAHLKIGDESGPWIEFLERENNVIKAFLKQMNREWENEIDEIEVEHIISPFIQNDEMNEIKKWTTANGGKPVVSQLESIQNLGISQDPVKTMEMINDEAAQANAAQLQSVMQPYM